MEKELDPEIIKTTQNSLGKYVKRPALSEKLLKKPPFRFLHDIVTSVLKSTGFFEGLFDEGELISENVKDRESKIAFLNKVVTVLSITTGKSLQVKPSKIVAGQEADKTNELLQCLAYALDKNMKSQSAVEKFKANSVDKQEKQTKEIKSVRKVNDDKKFKSSSTTKLTSEKKDSIEKSSIKQDKSRLNLSKTKNTISDKNETGKAKKELASKQSIKQSKSDIKNKANGKQAQEITLNSKSQSDLTEGSIHQTVKHTVEVVEQNNEKNEEQDDNRSDDINVNENKISENNLLNSSYVLTDNNDLNSSLSSQDLMEPIDRLEAVDTKETSDGYPPESSIKIETLNKSEDVNIIQNINQNVAGFTKLIKDSENKSVDEALIQSQPNSAQDRIQSAMRPSSSRPGAPRLRDKHDFQVVGNENIMVGKVKIIQENTSIEEEEDTSIIIVDPKSNETQDDSIQLSSNQHGHLVQQILDSTKVYSQNSGKTEIEWQFDALKVREASNQEIEQVRFNIQALSRVANPLGKLLDHIQEDVEVMRQELQQWTKTYEDASKELTKQKTANEESLLPLHIKIKQLDLDIDEKHDKINDLRITIHKNASRIDKLLASGNVQ